MIRFEADLDYAVKQMLRIKRTVNEASVLGMEKAMAAFMDDCLDEVPMPPKKTGRMRASHSIFVNGVLLDTSQVGSGIGTPLTSIAYVPTGKVEGALFCNTEYAMAVHEGVGRGGAPAVKYTTPGTGKKWIESKFIRHSSKYYGIVGNTIMRAK